MGKRILLRKSLPVRKVTPTFASEKNRQGSMLNYASYFYGFYFYFTQKVKRDVVC